MSITGECARNADSQNAPQTYCIKICRKQDPGRYIYMLKSEEHWYPKPSPENHTPHERAGVAFTSSVRILWDLELNCSTQQDKRRFGFLLQRGTEKSNVLFLTGRPPQALYFFLEEHTAGFQGIWMKVWIHAVSILMVRECLRMTLGSCCFPIIISKVKPTGSALPDLAFSSLPSVCLSSCYVDLQSLSHPSLFSLIN